MDRSGTGGIIHPPQVSPFAKHAADDFFANRMVDDRFDKRVINILRPQESLSDTLRFDLKGIFSTAKLNENVTLSSLFLFFSIAIFYV